MLKRIAIPILNTRKHRMHIRKYFSQIERFFKTNPNQTSQVFRYIFIDHNSSNKKLTFYQYQPPNTQPETYTLNFNSTSTRSTSHSLMLKLVPPEYHNDNPINFEYFKEIGDELFTNDSRDLAISAKSGYNFELIEITTTKDMNSLFKSFNLSTNNATKLSITRAKQIIKSNHALIRDNLKETGLWSLPESIRDEFTGTDITDIINWLNALHKPKPPTHDIDCFHDADFILDQFMLIKHQEIDWLLSKIFTKNSKSTLAIEPQPPIYIHSLTANSNTYSFSRYKLVFNSKHVLIGLKKIDTQPKPSLTELLIQSQWLLNDTESLIIRLSNISVEYELHALHLSGIKYTSPLNEKTVSLSTSSFWNTYVKTRNQDNLTQVSPDDVTHALNQLPSFSPLPRQNTSNRLYDNQISSLNQACHNIEHDLGTLLYLPTGFGKTRIAIEAMYQFAQNHKTASVLLVCGKSLINHWKDKIKEFNGLLPHDSPVQVTPTESFDTSRNKFTVTIVTKDALITHLKGKKTNTKPQSISFRDISNNVEKAIRPFIIQLKSKSKNVPNDIIIGNTELWQQAIQPYIDNNELDSQKAATLLKQLTTHQQITISTQGNVQAFASQYAGLIIDESQDCLTSSSNESIDSGSSLLIKLSALIQENRKKNNTKFIIMALSATPWPNSMKGITNHFWFLASSFMKTYAHLDRLLTSYWRLDFHNSIKQISDYLMGECDSLNADRSKLKELDAFIPPVDTLVDTLRNGLLIWIRQLFQALVAQPDNYQSTNNPVIKQIVQMNLSFNSNKMFTNQKQALDALHLSVTESQSADQTNNHSDISKNPIQFFKQIYSTLIHPDYNHISTQNRSGKPTAQKITLPFNSSYKMGAIGTQSLDELKQTSILISEFIRFLDEELRQNPAASIAIRVYSYADAALIQHILQTYSKSKNSFPLSQSRSLVYSGRLDKDQRTQWLDCFNNRLTYSGYLKIKNIKSSSSEKSYFNDMCDQFTSVNLLKKTNTGYFLNPDISATELTIDTLFSYLKGQEAISNNKIVKIETIEHLKTVYDSYYENFVDYLRFIQETHFFIFTECGTTGIHLDADALFIFSGSWNVDDTIQVRGRVGRIGGQKGINQVRIYQPQTDLSFEYYQLKLFIKKNFLDRLVTGKASNLVKPIIIEHFLETLRKSPDSFSQKPMIISLDKKDGPLESAIELLPDNIRTVFRAFMERVGKFGQVSNWESIDSIDLTESDTDSLQGFDIVQSIESSSTLALHNSNTDSRSSILSRQEATHRKPNPPKMTIINSINWNESDLKNDLNEFCKKTTKLRIIMAPSRGHKPDLTLDQFSTYISNSLPPNDKAIIIYGVNGTNQSSVQATYDQAAQHHGSFRNVYRLPFSFLWQDTDRFRNIPPLGQMRNSCFDQVKLLHHVLTNDLTISPDQLSFISMDSDTELTRLTLDRFDQLSSDPKAPVLATGGYSIPFVDINGSWDQTSHQPPELSSSSSHHNSWAWGALATSLSQRVNSTLQIDRTFYGYPSEPALFINSRIFQLLIQTVPQSSDFNSDSDALFGFWDNEGRRFHRYIANQLDALTTADLTRFDELGITLLADQIQQLKSNHRLQSWGPGQGHERPLLHEYTRFIEQSPPKPLKAPLTKPQLSTLISHLANHPQSLLDPRMAGRSIASSIAVHQGTILQPASSFYPKNFLDLLNLGPDRSHLFLQLIRQHLLKKDSDSIDPLHYQTNRIDINKAKQFIDRHFKSLFDSFDKCHHITLLTVFLQWSEAIIHQIKTVFTCQYVNEDDYPMSFPAEYPIKAIQNLEDSSIALAYMIDEPFFDQLEDLFLTHFNWIPTQHNRLINHYKLDSSTIKRISACDSKLILTLHDESMEMDHYQSEMIHLAQTISARNVSINEVQFLVIHGNKTNLSCHLYGIQTPVSNHSLPQLVNQSLAPILNILLKDNIIATSDNKDITCLPTSGRGDCAIHALFGKPDSNGFITAENVSEYRKKLAESIKKMSNGITKESIIGPISELIINPNRDMSDKPFLSNLRNKYNHWVTSNAEQTLNQWNHFESIVSEFPDIKKEIDAIPEHPCFKSKFMHLFNSDDNQLRGIIMAIPELSSAYSDYTQSTHESFPWTDYLTFELRQEYADIVQQNRQWLLPNEVHLLAICNQISVDFYTTNPMTNTTEKIDTFNPNQPQSISICFNGRDHYEQVQSSLIRLSSALHDLSLTRSLASVPTQSNTVSSLLPPSSNHASVRSLSDSDHSIQPTADALIESSLGTSSKKRNGSDLTQPKPKSPKTMPSHHRLMSMPNHIGPSEWQSIFPESTIGTIPPFPSTIPSCTSSYFIGIPETINNQSVTIDSIQSLLNYSVSGRPVKDYTSLKHTPISAGWYQIYKSLTTQNLSDPSTLPVTIVSAMMIHRSFSTQPLPFMAQIDHQSSRRHSFNISTFDALNSITLYGDDRTMTLNTQVTETNQPSIHVVSYQPNESTE